MTITEMTERCTHCRGLMASPPAPRACEDCGRVRTTPRHELWPPALKRWVVYQTIRRSFHRWLTKQEAWERLLCAHFNSPTSPDKTLRLTSDADLVYTRAVQLAEDWVAKGAPMDL